MYLGRYQLGQSVLLPILTVDGSGVPAEPSDAPLVSVYDGSGARVKTIRVPPIDRNIVTGHFGFLLFLGRDFAVGEYVCNFTYTLSGNSYMDEAMFEIIPGGSPDGAIIAMVWYERPHGRFLVQQLDSGQLIKSKNPYL